MHRMAVDDPISQAENLIASDERQEPIGLAKNLAEVAALLPPVSAVLGPFPGLISKWLSRHREENRDYMVAVLKNEVKRLRNDVDGLSEEQKTFYDKDYMPLVLDGLKKSEDLRAKERIARIAKILAYAAEQGPTRSPDYTEEMMRVAMALDDNDVYVLRDIENVQTPILSQYGDNIGVDEINRIWREHRPRLEGMSDGALQSICAKLHSYGLIIQLERRNTQLGPNEIPYALLPKGRDFVRYIKGVA